MRQAFRGHIPQELLEKLQPGDLFFVQSLGSWLSWMIMYLTQSEISHVAVYAGDRRILHATPDGVSSDFIDAIVRPDTLVVPCGLPLNVERRDRIKEFITMHSGASYDWNTAIWKGLRIVIGREPVYFRWTFFLDVGVLLGLLDIPVLLVTGEVMFLWLLLVYAFLVAANTLFSFVRPLKVNRQTAKPVEVFLLAWQMEADFYLVPPESTEE